MDLANEPAFTSGGSSTPRPGTPSVPPPAAAAAPDAATGDAPSPAQAEGSASASSSSTLPASDAPAGRTAAGGLEEEVNQVVSQLSTWGTSFWGGLRKQSASALEAVKKDMSRTVAEVQDEFHKLQTQTVEVDLKAPSNKGKGKAEGEPGAAAASSDFLSKLQSTIQSATSSAHLPGNLHLSENFATLQKSVSDTISAAAQNPNLDPAHIRTTLVSNIQKNLQGVNLKQAEKLAEEYLKKSEGLLAEAGTFLKDAVKVVPPEQGAGLALAWDGSDMYSFSTSADNAGANDVLFDRSNEPSRPASFETLRAQRKDALIRRLRSDKELLLVDPAAANETLSRREAYKAFVEAEVEGKGGIDGDDLIKAISEELGPNSKDSEALNATMHALVPSSLTKEVFWSRYFFHKHQIELEEEKRKKLLAVTQQPKEEEDFSWDDAEDETSPQATEPVKTTASAAKAESTMVAPAADKKTPSAESTPTLGGGAASEGKFGREGKGPSAVAARAIGSSTSTSPRESEESYDIVSDQAAETAGKAAAAKQDKGSDSDSDWE